jgi:hypothetical protein
VTFDNGFGFLFGFFGLLGIIGLVLMIWALVDCLQVQNYADYQSGTKLVWVLVIIFLSGLGAILYLLIGRPKPGQQRPGGGGSSVSAPPGQMPPPPPGALG